MMKKRYPVTMMCAACIPWTNDFQFDEASFRSEVKHLVDNAVKSIYIFGTAGEGYALNTKVFSQIVGVFLDECSKGENVMPMTGIISTSMMEILERIEIARDLGCKDFQIALPCWGALSNEEVVDFFKLVCNKFSDCRFIHYNNGARSKKLCTIDLYMKLAKEVDNLVAVKYSTSNTYEIYNTVKSDSPITFFLVDSGGYTYGSMVGTCGFLNSFASVDMNLAWKYFYAGQNNQYKKLFELDQFYKELEACFSFIDRDMIDSAYDKVIEKVANSDFNHFLFPPYKGLTDQEFAIVDKKMKAVIKKYNEK